MQTDSSTNGGFLLLTVEANAVRAKMMSCDSIHSSSPLTSTPLFVGASVTFPIRRVHSRVSFLLVETSHSGTWWLGSDSRVRNEYCLADGYRVKAASSPSVRQRLFSQNERKILVKLESFIKRIDQEEQVQP